MCVIKCVDGSQICLFDIDSKNVMLCNKSLSCLSILSFANISVRLNFVVSQGCSEQKHVFVIGMPVRK